MKILMTIYEFPPVGGGGGQVAKTLSMELDNGMVIHRIPSLLRDLRSCSVPAAASSLACAMPILPGLLRERRS